jgi:hypothetical protein
VKHDFATQYFSPQFIIQEDGKMPRIVWIILLIVIFGAAMFFLRRYMER